MIPKKVLGPKHFETKKMVQNKLSPEKFWVNQNFGQKTFNAPKKFGPKILVKIGSAIAELGWGFDKRNGEKSGPLKSLKVEYRQVVKTILLQSYKVVR